MSAALIQGSAEWLAARAGSLGASQVADAIARIKAGYGASRANVMAQLLTERITGQPTDSYVSPAMAWGKEVEPQARAAYAWEKDCEVEEVGLVRHPTIAGTHASPDGLIGADGLVEIKAPNTSTHIDTLLSDAVPGRYLTQIQWQLSCTGRAWCDYVSFDPRCPGHLRLYIQRVPRDDARIAELETEVRAFLAELDAKLEALTARYGRQEAA